MVEHKVSSLPVVEAGRVIGIITETDIFKQFAAVLGGGASSLRLTVQVADAPGEFGQLASRIAQVGGNITSVVAHAAGQPERANITLRALFSLWTLRALLTLRTYLSLLALRSLWPFRSLVYEAHAEDSDSSFLVCLEMQGHVVQSWN